MILLPREFEALGRISEQAEDERIAIDHFSLRILTGNRFVRTVNGQLVLTARGRIAASSGVQKNCREKAFVEIPDAALVG